jgi:hypothetical protein
VTRSRRFVANPGRVKPLFGLCCHACRRLQTASHRRRLGSKLERSRAPSRLLPPMGFPYHANMTEADLDAMVAYLRTL